MKAISIFSFFSLILVSTSAFTINNIPRALHAKVATPKNALTHQDFVTSYSTTVSSLQAAPDLQVVSLVAGQENYGLAIVALGEAIWSFSESPSLSHAKVLVPAIIAAIILFAVSGPMVTNTADPAAISLGLEVATGVSVFLGASYIVRLLAPFSPSAKEIAFLGLLFSVAGFFSFSQNLVVDGFVNLPELPELPSILPKNEFEE